MAIEFCRTGNKATAMVTVRMTAEQHRALKQAANDKKVSLNKLCVERLCGKN